MALSKRGHALNFVGVAGLLVIMTWSWFDQAMLWIPLALAGTRLGLRPGPARQRFTPADRKFDRAIRGMLLVTAALLLVNGSSRTWALPQLVIGLLIVCTGWAVYDLRQSRRNNVAFRELRMRSEGR